MRKKNAEVIQCSYKFIFNQKNVFLLLLRKKDSKLRTKINSSPGLIRAYGRTDVRTRVTTKFSWLDGFTNFCGYGALPAGAFGARGSSAKMSKDLSR